MGKSNFSLTELLKDDVRPNIAESPKKVQSINKAAEAPALPDSPEIPERETSVPLDHSTEQKKKRPDTKKTEYTPRLVYLKNVTIAKIDSLSSITLLTKKDIINQLLEYALSVYEEKNGKIKTIEKNTKKLL